MTLSYHAAFYEGGDPSEKNRVTLTTCTSAHFRFRRLPAELPDDDPDPASVPLASDAADPPPPAPPAGPFPPARALLLRVPHARTPPPLGGWLVKKIEMLACARDLEDDATAEPMAFTLTKLEDRVLGERATARMAGMSPPPPAPPELVENGAEGIAGLHRVGRDAALRLVAATIAEQTKRVALRGGAWHGGAVRVEPIKASDATAEKIPDAAEKIPAEKKHGKGEGIRVWFWLPGARQ